MTTTPLRPDLLELMARYEAEDNHHGTDKNGVHSYGPVYEQYFHSLRDTPLHLLELGIFSGASLVVWSEYFPQATIEGMDITLQNVQYGRGHPRIKMYETDATNASALDLLQYPAYDIIIDDASHQPDHQVESFRLFGHKLKPKGIYIIEDIAPHYAGAVQEQVGALCDSFGYTLHWHDLRSKKNRWDDIMAVIQAP